MLLVMPCVGILTTCACSVHVLTVKTGTEPQVELQIAVKWRLGRNVFEKQTPPRSHMPAEMLQEFQKLWKNFCTDDLLSANDLFFFSVSSAVSVAFFALLIRLLPHCDCFKMETS